MDCVQRKGRVYCKFGDIQMNQFICDFFYFFSKSEIDEYSFGGFIRDKVA